METWVEAAGQDDNQRYKNFLAYCVERREEAKRMKEGDEERKREFKRRKEVWDLMREAMEFLRKNKDKWKERKLEETKRIKEEEKRDRLAVVKEKKKRYNIQGLSREEGRRMKTRTEERLEIAKAKENYWKEFREVREEDTEMEEDERQAWRNVKLGMDSFEEERSAQNTPRGAQGGSS